MPYRDARAPRKVYRRAKRVMGASAALAAVVLALWALPGWGLPNTRLTMAFYLTLLMMAVGSGCVMMVAGCQLAIHHAFAAGLETGRASVWADETSRPADRQADPVLRLVE